MDNAQVEPHSAKGYIKGYKCPDPILTESLIRAHLKKYRMAGAVAGGWGGGGVGGCRNDMTKFVDFLETIGYPSYEWDLATALMFFGRRRSIVPDERREILSKYML